MELGPGRVREETGDYGGGEEGGKPDREGILEAAKVDPVGSMSESTDQRGGSIYGGQFSTCVSTWHPGLSGSSPCPPHHLLPQAPFRELVR